MRRRTSHPRPGATRLAIVVAVVLGLSLCGLGGFIVMGFARPGLDAMRTKQAALKRLKSQTVAMELARAHMIAQAEFEDQAVTIDALVAWNYVDPRILESPLGPASDGRDYWLHPAAPPVETVADPSRYVVVYDRAMYENDTHVSYGTLDGRGGWLSRAEFAQLLAEPPNGDVDYELPPR